MRKIARLTAVWTMIGVCAGCDDGAPPGAPPPTVHDDPQTLQPLDKVDLLFVVDNSISMREKQEVLAASIRKVVTEITEPPCVDEDGHRVAAQPADPAGACPAASHRAALPVEDLHIGVISSSLYGCDMNAGVGQDDFARLRSITGDGAVVPTYQDLGFLAWDPRQELSPPGEANLDALVDRAVTLVAGIGETGCGFEMPLEATARFLADPAPFASLEVDPETGLGVPSGVDDVLLAQRAAFLRPDSIVSIVVLSDENDCSTDPALAGYALGFGPKWRGTAACDSDPTSACCVSCGMEPPAGCSAAELACPDPMLPQAENRPNLACFDQKRRLGYDFHLPVARYQNALGAARIDPAALDWAAVGDAGVDNPLFGGARQPGHVVFTTIGGVPWQDLAVDPTDPASELKTSAELADDGSWALLVPDGASPPLDPFMIESVAARSGQSPVTGAAVASANPINGGDRPIADLSDLQYVCTFALETPMPDGGIDCVACADGPCDNPICDGSTQIGGKAYPGTRQLELARALGERGVVGSICPAIVGEAPQLGLPLRYSYDRPLEQMTSRVASLLPQVD